MTETIILTLVAFGFGSIFWNQDREKTSRQFIAGSIQEIIQNCPDLNCYTPGNCGINRIILTNNCCYTTIYFCLLLYCNFSH